MSLLTAVSKLCLTRASRIEKTPLRGTPTTRDARGDDAADIEVTGSVCDRFSTPGRRRRSGDSDRTGFEWEDAEVAGAVGRLRNLCDELCSVVDDDEEMVTFLGAADFRRRVVEVDRRYIVVGDRAAAGLACITSLGNDCSNDEGDGSDGCSSLDSSSSKWLKDPHYNKNNTNAVRQYVTRRNL